MSETSLTKIEESLQSIDMTRVIKYTKKIQELSKGANTQLAPIHLQDFIMAIDVTNVLLAKAIRTDLRADAYLKQSESIAYMDNAGEYLTEKGIKDTAEARKRYVPIDPAVMAANDMRAKTAAMVSFLRNKMMEFRMAHDDIKKIAYSGDYNNTEYEGM